MSTLHEEVLQQLCEAIPSFKVDHMSFPNTIMEDLRIDRHNLSECFAMHAEMFMKYSTLYELSVDHELKMKSTLERAYAQLDTQARALAEAQGIKMTEKKVENAVVTNAEYVVVQEQYLESKLTTGLLRAARDAMMHRRDALVSIGANQRAELNSDPSMRY